MTRPTFGQCAIHATQDIAMVGVFALLGSMMFQVATALRASFAIAFVFGLGAFLVGGAYFRLAVKWWFDVLRGR